MQFEVIFFTKLNKIWNMSHGVKVCQIVFFIFLRLKTNGNKNGNSANFLREIPSFVLQLIYNEKYELLPLYL